MKLIIMKWIKIVQIIIKILSFGLVTLQESNNEDKLI